MSTCSCRKHAVDPTCHRHGTISEAEFRQFAEQKTIVTQVIEDLRERETYGMEQYGVPLLSDSRKADALQEAYEEALDLCVYLRLELERRGNLPPL